MATQETSTSYQWDNGGIVTRVDVRTQKNGQSVAYLYADNDPSKQEERLNIRAAIRLKGWGTLSDHRDHHFSLRVSGLRNAQELVDMLEQEGFVGKPQQTITAPIKATDTPTTLWGKIRANSLRYSGIIATVGNAMSFMSGVHRKNEWGQIGQGLAFGVADLPLAIAGEPDDARQLDDFLRRLKTHYDKEGVEIPRTASIYVETSDKGKGFGELFMDYMHRYANQIKCSMEVVAAGSTIYAGHKQDSAPKKYVPLIWGSGFLASLLIPEKKIDEDKYTKAGMLERAWMKVEANPLMVGGLLGYSNTIATYASAVNERNHHLNPKKYPPKIDDLTKLPKDYSKYGWDFAIPSVMISANGLYAMSKKTVGGDIKNDAVESDAYTVAAQIINKQPEALREKVIESTARFFAERTEIKENHTEALARLRKEIEVQRQNPWFEPLGLGAYTPKPKHNRVHNADAVTPATVEMPAQVASPTELPKNLVAANDSVHAGHVEQAAELAQNHA